jgi:hypothetical protein
VNQEMSHHNINERTEGVFGFYGKHFLTTRDTQACDGVQKIGPGVAQKIDY